MPVYNERATVEEIVGRVLAVPLRIELVAVDDASTDGTRDVLAAARPRARIQAAAAGEEPAARARPCGGASPRPRGDVIVVQDADLEYSPEEYPELIDLIVRGKADAVFGSRFIGRHRCFLFTHYLANLFLNLVTNVLYNTTMTDMETCFKAVRAELLKSLELKSDRFGIEPEITAKLFKRGARVYEVPITYEGRDYSEGKKVSWKDGFPALWTLVKYRFTDLGRFRALARPATGSKPDLSGRLVVHAWPLVFLVAVARWPWLRPRLLKGDPRGGRWACVLLGASPPRPPLRLWTTT